MAWMPIRRDLGVGGGGVVGRKGGGHHCWGSGAGRYGSVALPGPPPAPPCASPPPPLLFFGSWGAKGAGRAARAAVPPTRWASGVGRRWGWGGWGEEGSPPRSCGAERGRGGKGTGKGWGGGKEQWWELWGGGGEKRKGGGDQKTNNQQKKNI